MSVLSIVEQQRRDDDSLRLRHQAERDIVQPWMKEQGQRDWRTHETRIRAEQEHKLRRLEAVC